MAKVKYPLLSGSAKGKFGVPVTPPFFSEPFSAVYYDSGLVRSNLPRIDAKSAAQIEIRTVVREVLSMIKDLGGIDRGRMQVTISSAWHLKVSSWLVKDSMSNAQALRATWFSWDQGARDAWNNLA